MAAKFLYLVTTYKLQDQALRLIDVLHRGGTEPVIVVRHDDTAEPLDPRIARHPGVHVAPGRAPVKWGDASYLDAVLDTLAWALAEFDVDWVTLLSGQDYPLMPLPTLEQLESQSDFDGFIQAVPVDRAYTPEQAALRTQYQWRALRAQWLGHGRLHRVAFGALGGVSRRTVRVRIVPENNTVLLGRRQAIPALNGLALYGMSDYFTVARHLAEAALSFRDREPAVTAYMRRALNPSELYFPTVFMASTRSSICTTPRRFKVFPKDSPHPRVLTVEHLDRMLSSGCHFARKFDHTVDTTVLDELDKVIGAA